MNYQGIRYKLRKIFLRNMCLSYKQIVVNSINMVNLFTNYADYSIYKVVSSLIEYIEKLNSNHHSSLETFSCDIRLTTISEERVNQRKSFLTVFKAAKTTLQKSFNYCGQKVINQEEVSDYKHELKPEENTTIIKCIGPS